MTELEEAELTEGQGRVFVRAQNCAGVSRLCQGDDAARVGSDRKATCASLGPKAAGSTKQHRSDALRDAHLWLDELTTDSNHTIAYISAREKKTERSIRLTMSLAFLSPALVKAAIDGRLPRGFGIKRLMDLPMAWSDQWSALGLKAPAQA